MDKPGLRDALPQPRQSDTRNDPFWSSLDSSLSAAAAATPQPAEPVAKRDLDVGLGDVARGVGAGALDLVGGIGELARQASNFGKENAGKQGGDYLEQARANMANKLSPLLDVVAGAGDLAASGAESLNDGMSADAKEALGRRLVDETPEGRLTLGDGAGDIDVWAMKMAQGVGSLLPTLAAGGVTGVAAKASIGRAVTASMVKRGATQEVAEAVAAKAVSKIATGAAVTTGATGSVGSAGVNTRDTVLGMSFDELAGSDTFRQSFTRIDQDQQTAHLSDEEKLGLAREETANLASRATMSDAKVWGAAAMGSMMGDAMLFKMLAGKAATGGVLKGAAKGAAGEGISETLEEGVQQYAVNESLNEVAAADIDPMKGVMSSAIEGGLIGMGTGGAVGAVGGARGGKHASQEDGVGTEPVAEPSAPVTEGAAGPAVDPNFASVPLEDGEQAPSASQAEGELNPLGPSASQFDELRDVPAYLRRDDTAARFKGMAADSKVQRALAGEFGQSVQELVASQMQAGDQGKSLYERAQAGELGLDPFAGNKSAQQVAMENQRLALPLKDVIFAGDANAKPVGEAVAAPGDHDDQQAGPGPQFRGGERTRWQNGQEGDLLPPEAATAHPAGELPGAVIEGEASEVGNELPHRNVVYGNDLRAEQQRAADLARRERELNNQPPQIGQSETLFAGGTPGADPRNSAYTPPRLSRDQVDTSMGEQSTRDPRSPVAQSIEQAGSATDSVFGPLKSLRITRKGKPFATEKEAVMASRRGQEMPVPLNGGGFGVAEIAEVEQVKAAETTQPSVQQLDDISVTDPNQPSDQSVASVSAETVPAPSATAGEASQLVPAIDTGYREVIPGNQPQAEVSNEPVTPIPAISSERSGDQPGAGDPVETSVGPTPAELAERAGPGDPADGTSLAPVPVTQPGEENSLTAQAPAGVAVSEEAQAEQARTTAGPAAAPTPWSEMIDNPDGTITLKGEVPIIKQWAKDNGVKAIPGKGGLVVAKSFTAKVRGLTAPAANEPSALVEAARGGVVPEPTEVDLIDRDLLKEHAGRWKYRSAVGAGWFTSNTKEGAIDRAREAYRRAFEKGDPVPTREERWEQSEREFAGRMDNRFGGMTIIELEKRHQNLGGTIADLQLAGRHEMNGNGGRRTGAAVANEGARQAGQEKMDLERYIQLRRDREEMAGSAPARMIEAARSEVAPEPTEAQKEAGNYKKGHLTLQGLDIALENPKGSTRSGIDPDGKEWQSTMAHDYGYIKRTLGADGDHVDVFIGDKPDSETVYVVDQVDPKTGKFDEHKVMMGFADEQAALEGYLGNYEEGWQGLGAIKAMTVVDFKRWVKEGDTTKAVSDLPASEPTIKQWVDSAPDDLLGGMSRLFKGDMSYGEFRDFAERTIISGEGIKAMFGGWTVPRLKEYLTANNAYVFSGTKKAELVERATRIMQGEVRWPSAGGAGVLTTTNNPFAKSNASPADALRAEVQGITEARYGEFVARRKELNAAHEARKQAIAKAIENPQTLDDYRTLARMKGREGMTAEQVGEYERLLTEAQLDKQDADKAAEQAAKLTATPSGDIIKTKHTKHGYDLFVVQMANRVEKDEYTRINAKAKETGGWYSSFKGSGAVPGFQFKEEAQATDFRAWLTGQGQAESKPSVTAEAPTVNMEEPASSPDDNVAKQIAGLRQRAETIRTKANAALAVDRKANTLRRAGMAARATAAAEEELKTADLLDAIADGVTTGKANILRNLTTKAQLATLRSRLARAMYDLPNAEYERLKGEGLIRMGSQGRHEWTDKAGPLVRVEGAKMPGLDYWTRQLDDLASEMQASSNRSHKAAGVKLKNLAKAAEANQLRQVAVTDRDLIDKLTAFVRGSQEGTQAFRVAEQLTDADRLNKMGIFSRANLRAALVELQAIEAGLGKRAEVSPLRTKEQALKLKLLGNRNAFIDFFPTTEDDAADLAGRLGIEPGMTVLEPSAGHGMLADAARDAGAKVDAVEIAGDLRDILTEKGHTLIGNDFMALTPTASYDAVIMNPPFSNGMDMDHVRHAYDFLKPGGRLAAIVSAGAGQQSTRKGQEFAAWLDALGAEVELMREGAFKDSLNPTSVRTKIIVLEKPVGETAPSPSPEGKRVTVATPKGNAVEVQYRVVEAADLVTSHDFEGNINHNYPQQLQPRDRSKQTYRVQVGQLAAAPDGARLAASPETDRGAPIVSGLVVESGNGRSIGLRQAYQRGDADAYRRYIEANAADFGIDPAVIGAMKQPVLVRERITTMTDDQLRDFVVDSNTDAKMANSAAEDAGADAGKLTDDMLDLLNIPEGGDVLASQNNRFLQAFLSAIGENQSNSYVSRDGQWNDAYRKRVTAAIFAYGYDNQRLLDAATGEVDADGRNITTALINNAVGMAKLRQHSPERAKVISNYLAEAVESIARAKRSGQSLQEMAAQSDMLGGDTSPEGSLLAQAIAASARSAKAITGMVGDILTMLNKTTSADMFGAAVDPATPETAINETLKAISAYNQQKASQPKPGGDLFGLAGARNNHGAAPSVPRSGDASAAKGAGGVTEGRLELDGVSIRIPAIDEEQQRLYNQATHRGQGVNFASGISTGVGRILNDLKDAGLLDTAEQRAAAEAEVQAWANEEAINARKLMRDGIKNPSWAITGRSGRKAQSSAAQDAENRRQAAHHKDQSDRITALRGELKKLRPKEVIGKESFNYAWGKAKGMIADYASAQSNGQPNLLASLRKSMNAELARYLQSMGKIDAPNFIKTLKEQDQRLKAAGHDGLVAIVGARSNPGKIISNAIDGRIRFSKQAMSQGMRPAKHLTRKEAELVTKGWFKQYRGASGIDVQIHATQAELEESLGLDAKEGLIRRAAFDDDAGTLHVAADTISDPKRMREILRHEVLAHYGLANVLGDGEYTKLMSRLIGSQKDPSMKPVWDWVNTHYADEDIGTKAEEVVAHLAELEQGAWGRGWDRVVAWVTRALRAVGFVPDGITAAETRSLIEGLGKKLQRSGPDDSGPDGGKKFSQEAERPTQKGGIKMSQASTAADAAMEKLNLGPKPDIIDKTKASLNKLRQVDRGVVSSWIDRVIKKANTEVLDALAPIKYAEEAAGITDAADSGYVAARMATGAASTMQATMLYGLPEWNDGVIQRKAGTGEKDALLGIFADLGADLHNWLGWMAGHRAELLMAQGRENLLDANDIAALKGQGKGKEAKFLDAKARWNRLNAATLDLAQEAGLFTKEARAEFESEWYIPFFRESDDGDVIAPFKTKGIANQNSGIKKLKGGEANTNDLLENIFTSTSKLIDASMKNMAAQKTVWNLADTGIIEVIPKPNKMDYQALANGKDRIMVKLEGEDYMIRVEDPDLYRAMTFFDRKPFSAMVNVAAKAKRLLTAGVTASPEFMLRNFLRDSLSSWAISKDGFRPVIDSIKGVKKTLAMDGSTIDVMFSGASFLGGYVNGNDPEAMADTVRKSLRRKGMTPEQIARYEKSIIRNAAQAKGVVANVWEKYNRYGEAFENANREAVYAAAIKAGKSHAQAAFESKDLMDFSMLGASRTMQVMTQLLPFFNARVQGLGKLSRELRDNPREIAKRAGMITAASLALLAANWDDERYEELPDWDKDANWHFFVGDQHFRIPKPFEIGVLFGTIPERMVRALGDKDTGAQFGKAVARAVGETFALNPTPQIVKPLVESYFNYDAFRGIPIENAQDLAVKVEARYNEQTSLMMRELGEATGMSPKKLEHLLIGYTGTIGGYVMATADGLIRAAQPGESASWRADEIPLVKAVYRGTGPAKSTQHMEEFYRMLNEVNQLKRTVDQYRSEGLTDKANELLEEQGGILKSRRSLSRTQQQVRVVRNKIELIQRDRILSADEKRRRIDELMARRNDLVYQAVNHNRQNWE
ncbi:LPD38 domain-containing protein [Aeromonas sp. FDAARGOS 1406]|uniref:LPD38 domain-containing protein n=1 Tax=Aeromonas sp. FDAARGOS 1406 TaxID=2778055 RepID=UPI0020B4113F|nr:LPD38 domain-containing protein [Aeromonas sp. FDAARGOS 1406]